MAPSIGTLILLILQPSHAWPSRAGATTASSAWRHNKRALELATGFKQDPRPVNRLLADPSLRKDGGVTGALAFPKFRLVLCSYPKGATTVASWIALRLAGVKPACICKPHLCVTRDARAYDQLRQHPEILSHPHSASKHGTRVIAPEGAAFVRRAWDEQEVKLLRHMDEKTQRAAFLNESWTTVVLTRDPWVRAVSAYKDQVHRNVVRRNASSRDGFLAFTLRREGDRHHTALASDFCGLSTVKFDMAIDVGSGWSDGWRELVSGTKRRSHRQERLRALLTTGWEDCLNGAQSIVGAVQARTGHEDKVADGAAGEARDRLRAKLTMNDRIFCNVTTTRAIAHRYARDYEMLKRSGAGYIAPYACAST
ncbi:hypothetical protein KFE25_002123 [Diacronema lutheri]|uniref:Sulfotransferase domain-containing protein n=2 Tax=Diacronema lutheri TaxID=2081491 RepID=A0A8J5XQ98_DIALT|nr:hypothetical protein KFE25_002123 [Diacronema lutheri]